MDCGGWLSDQTLATLPRNHFEVVVCRSGKARSIFRHTVHDFQCPVYGRTRWTTAGVLKWHSAKEDLEEAIQGFYADSFSMLAFNNDTACAAALYTDTHRKRELLKHIRNRGVQCRGGGAAILCHLLQDEDNLHPPLRIVMADNDSSLTRYYESFGCIVDSDVGSGLTLDCRDPHPQKCDQYVDGKKKGPKLIDADDYEWPEYLRALAEDADPHQGEPKPRGRTLIILGIIIAVALGFFLVDVIHAWNFIHA